VRDLETVVEANGLRQFALLGISQGCAVAIAYAVRHPERVSRLILYGGYARGRRKRGSQREIELGDAIITLMREGWGQESPEFRMIYTARFIPGGTAEQMQWMQDNSAGECGPHPSGHGQRRCRRPALAGARPYSRPALPG
jgi:pimeloyl-ACP methyl ester carboxylesterase